MGIHKAALPAALLLLAMTVPAHAEQRDRGRRGGGEREGGRVAVERGRVESQGAAPRVESRRAAPRAETRPEYRQQYRPEYRREAPRVVVTPRYVRPYYVRPYYVRPYSAYRYARPYYTFRPRVSLGFGIWIGEPVPYPVYTAPYPYPPAYSYPGYSYPASQYPVTAYPPAGTIAPQAVGGLSFDISPSNALVYVDGQYAGIVGDFTAASPPLSLAPGRHHVEVQADGYVPMTFDVDVIAGQVVPYRGDLRPY